MTAPSLHPFKLGPDTVEVIKRTTTGTVVDGRPEFTETVTEIPDCSAREINGREDITRTLAGGGIGTTIATLDLDCHLPVIAAALELDAGDAIRHRGRVFELQTPAVQHDDANGAPSHVRALGRWVAEASDEQREQVTIVPAGARLDDGTYAPDGAPFDVLARSVAAGNQAERFGAGGRELSADYTVALDPDVAIASGDWIIVRGLDCRALVALQESEWAERRELVVLAQHSAGGRT